MSQKMFSGLENLQFSGRTADQESPKEFTSQAFAPSQESSASKTFAQITTGFVQQHPGEAILISAAVGLIFAMCLPGDPSTTPDYKQLQTKLEPK